MNKFLSKEQEQEYAIQKIKKIKKISIKLLLAKKFDPEKINATGWYMSEKLDGIRAYWSFNNKQFYTRNGNPIITPEWFSKTLLTIKNDLDGELWINRGIENFNKINGMCRKHDPIDSDWSVVKYLVFDIPDSPREYEKRVEDYTVLINSLKCDWIIPVSTTIVKNNEHIIIELTKIEKLGGEGLMIRKPHSLYECKRSDTLLKIKSFEDEEGIVIGYEKGIGTGKYSDITGSLIVKTPTGTIKIGTGLDDETRNNPPKIGSLITYKYFEKSKDGIPRFPVYKSTK